MSKIRRPKMIVALVELEDNCGAVLAKAKVEIPVDVAADTIFEGHEAEVAEQFRLFLKEKFPAKFKL